MSRTHAQALALERKRRQRRNDRIREVQKLELQLDAPTRSLLRDLGRLTHRPLAHCAQQLLRQSLPEALRTWRSVQERAKASTKMMIELTPFLTALRRPGTAVTVSGKTYTSDQVRHALEERERIDAWLLSQGMSAALRRRFLLTQL